MCSVWGRSCGESPKKTNGCSRSMTHTYRPETWRCRRATPYSGYVPNWRRISAKVWACRVYIADTHVLFGYCSRTLTQKSAHRLTNVKGRDKLHMLDREQLRNVFRAGPIWPERIMYEERRRTVFRSGRSSHKKSFSSQRSHVQMCRLKPQKSFTLWKFHATTRWHRRFELHVAYYPHEQKSGASKKHAFSRRKREEDHEKIPPDDDVNRSDHFLEKSARCHCTT